MPVVTKMLEAMGPPDHIARIHKLMSDGMSRDAAVAETALQFLAENNRMLRALLLMHGRNVPESSLAEAVHTLR